MPGFVRESISAGRPRPRQACLWGALVLCVSAWAADYPAPVEGDYVVKDFRFTTGETQKREPANR